MPTVHRQGNWKITMYFRDHDPPHFHIMIRSRREAQVRISDLTVMAGAVPTSILRSALSWANANKFALNAKWRELHPKIVSDEP
jgi:hypothetical protein